MGTLWVGARSCDDVSGVRRGDYFTGWGAINRAERGNRPESAELLDVRFDNFFTATLSIN